MSEVENLKQAREFIVENKKDQASKILWELYKSQNLKIKFEAILSLLATLDRLTENIKLLELVEEGIKIAPLLGENDLEKNLLVEKCNFLTAEIGFMIYRQKNLKMSANVFEWIDFATENEKNEFQAINQKCKESEEEIERLINIVLNHINNNNHYFNGNVFFTLGELYCNRFFNDRLDLMIGGKTRSMIGNIYFVKRWNLDKWLLRSEGRKKIDDDWFNCIKYIKLAISEYKAGGYNKEMAQAYYNLAVKYGITFRFRKAKKLLETSYKIAKENSDKLLLSQIEIYRKQIANKNREIRNYVGEYGLDLP